MLSGTLTLPTRTTVRKKKTSSIQQSNLSSMKIESGRLAKERTLYCFAYSSYLNSNTTPFTSSSNNQNKL
ncbi:hypothetical protein Bca101_007161 [Brassica carinata]